MLPFLPHQYCVDAFHKLCHNRRHHPPNSDIWDFRFHWEKNKIVIIEQIISNHYILRPLQIITKKDKTQIAIWSSSDAFVIHLITLYLIQILPVHPKCEHIKGHGGGKQSVMNLNQKINHYHYVCRTDIKGYYANINKSLLLSQLRKYISNTVVLNLIAQFLYFTVEKGGNFHTPNKGIPRSSSLSPLLAAFHLYCIDDHFSTLGHLHYIRYMDDFIILTKTRWHLKKAIKQLNLFFAHFGFKQHPDKTVIGKISRGFDWMGFWFTHTGCQSVAPRAIANHVMKLHRLYEQIRNLPAKLRVNRMMRYSIRWNSWKNNTLLATISLLLQSAKMPSKYQESPL